MKIENVNAKSAQSFTALKPDVMMDATLFKSILDAKTVKAFGKKYDATVGIEYFQSSNPHRKSESYIALTLSNIKPVNPLLNLKNVIKKSAKNIVLKTHATNKAEFVDNLSRKSSDMLINLYKKVSKR